MTDNNATLYKICLHPKADEGFINQFSKAIGAYPVFKRSILIDSLAKFIAEKFTSGEASFEETDLAINNLAGYAIKTENITDFMWQIYLAFDEAELSTDGYEHLSFTIRRVLATAA